MYGQELTSSPNLPERAAGGILIVTTFLLVLAVLHHPIPHAHDLPEFIAESKAVRWLNQIVHGAAIALVVMLLFSLSYLSTALGGNRLCVRFAMCTYAVGTMAMITAAIISGWVVPLFLDQLAEITRSNQETITNCVTILRVSNQAADLLGVACYSTAVTAWSIGMLTTTSPRKLSGAVGIVAGLTGIAAMAFGIVTATVHGVIVFALIQSAWYVLVGVDLLRNKVNPET